MGIDAGYERLAEAIIIRAVKDYVSAVKKLDKDPYDCAARYRKREVEQFVKSELFVLLTDLNPDVFLEKLKERAAKKCKTRRKRREN